VDVSYSPWEHGMLRCAMYTSISQSHQQIADQPAVCIVHMLHKQLLYSILHDGNSQTPRYRPCILYMSHGPPTCSRLPATCSMLFRCRAGQIGGQLKTDRYTPAISHCDL
jgi:hypothetical protein